MIKTPRPQGIQSKQWGTHTCDDCDMRCPRKRMFYRQPGKFRMINGNETRVVGAVSLCAVRPIECIRTNEGNAYMTALVNANLARKTAERWPAETRGDFYRGRV